MKTTTKFLILLVTLMMAGTAAGVYWIRDFLFKEPNNVLPIAVIVLAAVEALLIVLLWKKIRYQFRLLTNILRFSLFFLYAWSVTFLTVWVAFKAHSYFADRLGVYYQYYIYRIDAIYLIFYFLVLVGGLFLAGGLAKKIVNSYRIATREERQKGSLPAAAAA